MHYEFNEKKDKCTIECMAYIEECAESICKCRIQVDKKEQKWTISSWFTKSGYGNKGYGKKTMKAAMEYVFRLYGFPQKVEYIWNGANEYVLNWLEENFDAVCNCPIAVQKTQADDDWDSHEYDLNVQKVMQYFGVHE